MTPENVVAPLELTVNPKPPLTAPENAIAPMPPIVVLPVNVTLPASEAGPVQLIALPLTPVPETETASAPMLTALMSSVAPLAMEVPPAVLPSADTLLARRVPAVIVVVPE